MSRRARSRDVFAIAVTLVAAWFLLATSEDEPQAGDRTELQRLDVGPEGATIRFDVDANAAANTAEDPLTVWFRYTVLGGIDDGGSPADSVIAVVRDRPEVNVSSGSFQCACVGPVEVALTLAPDIDGFRTIEWEVNADNYFDTWEEAEEAVIAVTLGESEGLTLAALADGSLETDGTPISAVMLDLVQDGTLQVTSEWRFSGGRLDVFGTAGGPVAIESGSSAELSPCPDCQGAILVHSDALGLALDWRLVTEQLGQDPVSATPVVLTSKTDTRNLGPLKFDKTAPASFEVTITAESGPPGQGTPPPYVLLSSDSRRVDDSEEWEDRIEHNVRATVNLQQFERSGGHWSLAEVIVPMEPTPSGWTRTFTTNFGLTNQDDGKAELNPSLTATVFWGDDFVAVDPASVTLTSRRTS